MGAEDAVTLGIELETVERCFQGAYGRLRGERSTDVPLLVVVADELVLRRGGARESFALVPSGYLEVKAASHLAVASFLAIWSQEENDSLRRLRDMSAEAIPALEHASDHALREPLLATLRATQTVLETALVASSQGTEERRLAAESFAREVRAPMEVLMVAAAALQLDAIHRSVEAATRKLAPGELGTVRAVVAGNHQARRRSLPMQYFQRRMPDREGGEPRVVYGENVTTEDEALALLGTLRADRVLAQAFFGDPSRMDRDLLGDAAGRRLDAMNLGPLGVTHAGDMTSPPAAGTKSAGG